MKAKFILFVMSSSLLIGAQSSLAQITDTNTNSLPLVQTVKYQETLKNDRSLGERPLLPPGLKESRELI